MNPGSKAYKHSAARPVMAVFLVLFYVFGTIGADFSHTFLHQHVHADAHTFEAEKDPCHRAIYHHDTQKSCDHKSHVSTPEKCSVTHLALQVYSIITAPVEVTFSGYTEFSHTAYYASVPETEFPAISLRGPPAR